MNTKTEAYGQQHETKTEMTERLRHHYEVEKALASELRNATREERQQLYASLYDQLYQRVPNHSQLTRKASAASMARMTAQQMRFLRRFLHREMTFLEIGPGDCALSLEVAKHVRQVYAVDVSAEVTQKGVNQPNFALFLSDGVSIPIAEQSADVAYSDQLMEHLHPDDAFQQLENIYRALSPGGVYLCVTPNRISGPHDISRHFDTVATGFHMKEYTVTELSALFAQVGFRRVHAYIGGSGYYIRIPLPLMKANERIMRMLLPLLPKSVRRRAPVALLLHGLLNIRLAAIK